MGVNDYLTRPVDRNELVARVRTQLRASAMPTACAMRSQLSLEMAITDQLTGLAQSPLHGAPSELADRQCGELERASPLSFLILDIDFFKNHQRQLTATTSATTCCASSPAACRATSRGIDLACRLGGEEFVVVMPDTGMERARQVGERVRECIAGEPFQADQGVEVAVTASVGVATLGEQDTFSGMFKRADRALYAAKRGGRNRVVADAA